jgi:EmrB/QacA subfamily drug resistance transporter
VFLVAALGGFMVFLDGTIVNIAFPAIRAAFPGTSQADLSWVLNAYSTVLAALLLAAGRLADRFGRRRLFFSGLFVFTAGSALCGVAPDAAALIAARALQATGAAMLVPTALALVLPEFPLQKRAMVVGLYGAISAIAAGCGPVLGSLLIEKADWRWAFYVNVPVGLATWLYGRGVLTESRDADARDLPDPLGIIMLALSMGGLALAIVEGNDWGWHSPRILAAFAIAALGILFSIWRAATHPAAVLDLTLFRVRYFSVANTGTVLFSAAFYALLLANVLFLTGVWHYTILQTGLGVTPGPLMAALTAPPAGRLAGRFGQRAVLVPGTLVFGSGLLLFLTRLGASPHYLTGFLPATLLTGTGVGLTLSTLSSASAAALPPARFALGSAVNSTARQFGAVLGIALLVAILGSPTSSQAALDGFRHGWTFGLAATLATTITALALGRRPVPVHVAPRKMGAQVPVGTVLAPAESA